MFLERGFEFTYEAVRDWEACFAPLIADQLRAKRRGQADRSWYVDETYVNVKGKWCSLSRAIDREGNLVDSLHGDEATCFPGSATRGVPPTIGSSEDPGAGGLTYRRMAGEKCPARFVDSC